MAYPITYPPHPYPWVDYNQHCGLFEFIVEVILMGSICVFGFAGNTISFIVLWQEKAVSSTTFLLQAVIIADMVAIWMLFIGDVMPALAYIIPLLQNCHTVCGYVAAVTQPLLLLGQICCIWFTLMALVNRYFVMCQPTHAPLICTVNFAKRMILVTMIVALIISLPLTFDSSLMLTYRGENGTLTTEALSQNYWYRLFYRHALISVVLYALPLLALVYFCLKLSFIMQSMRRLRLALATHKAQNLDMTQVLLTLAITVVICYCPLMGLKAVEWKDGDAIKLCGYLQYYLDSFSKMFICLNSSLKLVILALFAKKFKRCLKDTFCTLGAKVDFNIFGMYKCADASEMTLISQVDRNEGLIEPLNQPYQEQPYLEQPMMYQSTCST